MSKVPLKTSAKAMLCEFPDGGKFLVGEFGFDCPVCGPHTIRVVGHHMRTMARILAEWIEQYPDQTGPEDATLVHRDVFTVRAPGGDPTNN